MAWVILHREETVAFGALPLVTRGIAAELLKVSDIVTGAVVGSSGDWQGAICMRLGAHPRERKAVRSALDQLMSSGYLCSKSGVIWITNFETYQSKKAKKGAAHPAPIVDASSADGSRIVDGSSTDGSRMVVATSTDDALNDRHNASESFGFGKNNTYTQTDKQREKQGATTPAPAPPAQEPFALDAAIDAVNAARASAGLRPVSRMQGRGTEQALFAALEICPVTEVQAAYAAYIAAGDTWDRERDWPVWHWAKTPLRWIQPAAPSRRKSEWRPLSEVE